MNKKACKILPISCLCSIYFNTEINDFVLAIDSLLIQDYKPEEIIIIVDGLVSKDIFKFINYLRNYSIFKIYFLEKNEGLGNALKLGLTKCKNNLVARFDTDDINLKGRLKIQYDLFKKIPNASIIGSNIIEYKNLNTKEKYIIKKVPIKLNSIKNYSIYRNPINHPTVIFKKNEIINLGSYRNIKYFEDYDLWLRSLKNKMMIINIEEPLVAMKRETYLSNRKGIKYAIYELIFIKKALEENLIIKKSIPFFIIRVIIRLIPNPIIAIIKLLDQQRNLTDINLIKYINDIKNNPKSFSSMISKFIIDNKL